MPIVFEEIRGDIVPPPDPDAGRDRDEPDGPDELELDDRVRAVLARERFHALRLSDR